MSTKTGIEWTDATWNPIRGCTPVSAGCKNCYAAKVAKRFSYAGGPYEGLVRINAAGERTDDWNGNIRFVEEHLLDPLKWKPVRNVDVVDGGALNRLATASLAVEMRPRRIFVNSMSDLFHEGVTDEMRDKIFAVMALCPQYEFQVLTKRPERMLAYLERDRSDYWFSAAMEYPKQPMGISDLCGNPLANVWLGVSDEGNQHQRIDVLRKVPAAVRFISAEPLLFDPGTVDLTGIDWVICGGESGPGARPMHPDWARGLRDQCAAVGTPFFFKQWGEWLPALQFTDALVAHLGADFSNRYPSALWDGSAWELDLDDQDCGDDPENWTCRAGKHDAGALLDGCAWKQFPVGRA